MAKRRKTDEAHGVQKGFISRVGPVAKLTLLLIVGIAAGGCRWFGNSAALEIQLGHPSEAAGSLSALYPTEGGSDVTPRAVAGQTSMYFGLKGSQSGTMVAGYSGSEDFSYVGFRLSAIARDGETLLGWEGEPERFVLPDPSIHVYEGSFPAGTEVWSPEAFIARFTPTGSTSLIASRDDSSSSSLEYIDEVVFRVSSNGLAVVDSAGNQIPGVIVDTAPHFVVDDGTNLARYSEQDATLTVAGGSLEFTNLEYIVFVPASKVGANFNWFVQYENAVRNPILDDSIDSSEWELDPTWIDDSSANAGLFAMIDEITGITDPADRAQDSTWLELAQYFQRVFAKFYVARSTMFNINGLLGSSNTGSSFQVIALDDAGGPIPLGEDAVLGITYKIDRAELTESEGVLDLVAEPILEFSTAVVGPQ
jgi:hypothetical protein